jgi:hypothetical protein
MPEDGRDDCCVFFPPRWEEEEAGVLAPAVKISHFEVAWSPVLYTWTAHTRKSKQSAVRCCSFIGSRATGLYLRRKRLYKHAVGVEYLVWQNTLCPKMSS